MWEKLDDRKVLMLSALEKSDVSIIDLSNALSVSEKTIKNEIQILNHELKDGAYIYLKNGLISLFIYNLDNYNTIKNKEILSKNDFTNPKLRIFNITKKLLNYNDVQLDDLAEEMNISKSTLTKDIKLANEGLSQYGLKIYGKPNVGINLMGEELDKRYFILENQYDYMIGKAKFEDEYNIFLYNLLIRYFINEDTYQNLIKFFHISLDRLRKGNTLEFNFDKTALYGFEDYNEISQQIKIYVNKIEEIRLSNSEINFILIPLLANRTSSHINYNSNSDEIVGISDLTNKIFKRIKNQMDISVDLGEITENFTYHIYYLLNRIKLNYNIENPLSETIKNEYKVAYKMSEIAAEVIFEEKNKVINESEKSFLASYFQIYLFDKLNSSPVNQFNIAIVDKNKKEAVEILPLIQERFNRINATDYFRNVSEMPFNKNYDLILTTEPIHSNNVLYIPSGFYNKKLIRKELDDFYFKQSVFKKDKSLKSLIFTELRENNFYIGQSKDYETNLVRMLEYLEKIEIVDEDFTNAILLRESESSTKFSDQLAFPHVKSNEFILSLGLFPNSQIKVIIIVGIPSDDDTLIINLYDEIVTLATDNDFLNNVDKVKNYRQLMEFIIKDTKLFR